jgi:hypothetical protein
MAAAIAVAVVALAAVAPGARAPAVALHTRTSSLPRPSVVCEDPSDCTPELQSALDRGGSILLSCGQLGAAEPWITRPLRVTQNDTWLGLAAGCVLQAKRGEFHAESDSLLTIRERSPGLKPADLGRRPVRNASIVGVGGLATLRMWREDYNDSRAYNHSQHRHGIAILNAADVTVRDLNVSLSGGDGVYVAGLVGGHFQRVHCTANYRQGSSVIDAQHVLYEDCSFSRTSGTAPMAGVDIEPNGARQSFVNLTFRRCRSYDNGGGGFLLELYHLTAQSRPLNVQFEDCSVKNVGLESAWHGNAVPGNGLVVSSSSTNQSKTTASGWIRWRGGSITDTAWEGIHIARPEPGARITIENLELARNAVHMTSGGCIHDESDIIGCENSAAAAPPPPLLGPPAGSEGRGLRGSNRGSTSKGTPNPIFVLANTFGTAGAVTDAALDGVFLTNVTVSDTLRRPFAFVAGHARNVLGRNLTVRNTRTNGCGVGVAVPFGKAAHFAQYGGNVNLTISRCELN